MTGRAKWDAWDAAGKKYDHAEDAERRYIEIARSVGWTETVVVEPSRPTQEGTSESAIEDDEDDIWDDDSAPRRSGGGGVGTSVSSMAKPEEKFDGSIHGLAVSNDVSGLKFILDASPDTDLNALDEYVGHVQLQSFGDADWP